MPWPRWSNRPSVVKWLPWETPWTASSWVHHILLSQSSLRRSQSTRGWAIWALRTRNVFQLEFLLRLNSNWSYVPMSCFQLVFAWCQRGHFWDLSSWFILRHLEASGFISIHLDSSGFILIHLDSVPTASYLLHLQLTWSGTLWPNNQPVATPGGNLPGSGLDLSSSSLTAGERWRGETYVTYVHLKSLELLIVSWCLIQSSSFISLEKVWIKWAASTSQPRAFPISTSQILTHHVSPCLTKVEPQGTSIIAQAKGLLRSYSDKAQMDCRMRKHLETIWENAGKKMELLNCSWFIYCYHYINPWDWKPTMQFERAWSTPPLGAFRHSLNYVEIQRGKPPHVWAAMYLGTAWLALKTLHYSRHILRLRRHLSLNQNGLEHEFELPCGKWFWPKRSIRRLWQNALRLGSQWAVDVTSRSWIILNFKIANVAARSPADFRALLGTKSKASQLCDLVCPYTSCCHDMTCDESFWTSLSIYDSRIFIKFLPFAHLLMWTEYFVLWKSFSNRLGLRMLEDSSHPLNRNSRRRTSNWKTLSAFLKP